MKKLPMRYYRIEDMYGRGTMVLRIDDRVWIADGDTFYVYVPMRVVRDLLAAVRRTRKAEHHVGYARRVVGDGTAQSWRVRTFAHMVRIGCKEYTPEAIRNACVALGIKSRGN